jgi:hypothetical protein
MNPLKLKELRNNMSARTAIAKQLERDVLLEAGHRCAIPACKQTPVEIAHIRPWAIKRKHEFENLTE